MAEGSPSPLYSKTQSPVGSSQYPYLFFFVNPPHYAHLYNLYCVCLPAMLRKMWVMDSLVRGGEWILLFFVRSVSEVDSSYFGTDQERT